MCRYAMSDYRTHFVCVPCRRSFKHESRSEQRCPDCRSLMVDAGRDLEVPRRGDVAGWRALAVVLNSGLTFHGCGCNGPGYRPRTPAAVRQRVVLAARQGRPAKTVLERLDMG